MPRKSASGRKYKRDRTGQFAKVNTLTTRKPTVNPHAVKRRESSRALGKASVMRRKHEAYAEARVGKTLTPEVAKNVERANRMQKKLTETIAGRSSEMASQDRLAKSKVAGDRAFRRRTTSRASTLKAEIAAHSQGGAGKQLSKNAIAKKESELARIAIAEKRDAAKPKGRPMNRKAQRTRELDKIVANAANAPSQAAHSRAVAKARNRISPSDTKRKRASAKNANSQTKVHMRTQSNPLGEIRKGTLGATGRRVTPGAAGRFERENHFAKGIELRPPYTIPKGTYGKVSPEEFNRLNQREVDERYIPAIPGLGRFSRGASSPIQAGKIKVGDIIAIRQSRQSAYNSPSMHTTVHSKQYEVVNVGEDDAGVFYKVSQPGKAVKGKGGTKWRPTNLDTTAIEHSHPRIKAAPGRKVR